FRHPDVQKAAELDMRPNIAGNYRIKFKAETLPLKDQVGGYRNLFSHNAQFGLSQMPEGDSTSMATLARVFPVLEALKTSDTDRVELVNQTIVEEVLQDLGELDFGRGVTAESNIAIWRERGTHRPRLCENSCVQFARRKFFSFGQSENQKFWRRLFEEANRENCSTLSWLAHVFTRPAPIPDIPERGQHGHSSLRQACQSQARA